MHSGGLWGASQSIIKLPLQLIAPCCASLPTFSLIPPGQAQAVAPSLELHPNFRAGKPAVRQSLRSLAQHVRRRQRSRWQPRHLEHTCGNIHTGCRQVFTRYVPSSFPFSSQPPPYLACMLPLRTARYCVAAHDRCKSHSSYISYRIALCLQSDGA